MQWQEQIWKDYLDDFDYKDDDVIEFGYTYLNV